MAIIKGQTVVLHETIENGVDAFNRPILSENTVAVDNVLIEPVSNDAVLSELQISGKHVVYNLHIPKSDNHNWKNAKVEFYGQIWKTFGDCLSYDKNLTPLEWNKKVKVEKYV